MNGIRKSAIIAVLLVGNVVPRTSNATEIACFGDICNKATDNQFCSDYFEMCRNCADIIMDCGTPQQPPACTPYCINYKTELELQKKKDSNCTALNPIRNSAVNTTRNDYQQGDTTEIACEEGYEPHYTNTAQCGEFGIFHFSAPTCEVKTCTLSPMIANAFITQHPESNGRFSINTTITIICKESFTLIGASTMKCQGDDKWTDGAPFCLGDSYIWWRDFGGGLVTTCAVFLIVTILFSVILRQHYQRREHSKRMNQSQLSNRASLAESGIDVTEHDVNENSLMMNTYNEVQQTVIDEKDINLNNSISDKESINHRRFSDAIPSAPPTEFNPEGNQGGVMTNNTFNIYSGNVIHQTDNFNYNIENNDDKKDPKPDNQLEGGKTIEKTPTEESQTTVEASQETQDHAEEKNQLTKRKEQFLDLDVGVSQNYLK